MPRLLSNKSPNKLNAKDDFSIEYFKRTPFRKLSFLGINDAINEDKYRKDDWNFIYNDTTPLSPEEISFYFNKMIDFFYVKYEEYCETLSQAAMVISFCPNKEMSSETTTFGNKHSEIDFARRLLFEFGLDNSDDTEIDRLITRVKVDMFQEEMEKKYDPEMVLNKK